MHVRAAGAGAILIDDDFAFFLSGERRGGEDCECEEEEGKQGGTEAGKQSETRALERNGGRKGRIFELRFRNMGIAAPPNLLRLERGAIVCFLRLRGNSNPSCCD